MLPNFDLVSTPQAFYEASACTFRYLILMALEKGMELSRKPGGSLGSGDAAGI